MHDYTINENGEILGYAGEDYTINELGEVLVNLPSLLHNSLAGLQGGAVGEYYHLDSTDYGNLTDVNAQLANLHTDGNPTFVNITAAQVIGAGDPDTYMAFSGADTVAFIVGGAALFSLIEGATDYAYLDGNLQIGGNIIKIGDVDTYITWPAADQMAFYAGGAKLLDLVEGASDYVNIPAGLLYVNEIANTDMTQGLTINQGANDDQALALKSSDVNASYSWESDTYGALRKAEGSSGGLGIWGLKDSDGLAGLAVRVLALLGENADTTKSTAGQAIISLEAYQSSGGAIANVVADGNCFAVRARRGGVTVTVAIIDEDGDLHLDAGAGVGGTVLGWIFDEYDDGALLHGLRASLMPEGHDLRERFGEFIEYARPVLEEAGVVHYNDGPGEDGRPFVSMRDGLYLTIDAVRQLYDEVRWLRDRCQRYELALNKVGLLPT